MYTTILLSFLGSFVFLAAFATNELAMHNDSVTGLEILGDQDNQVDEYDLPPNDEARLIHRLIDRYRGYGLARPVAKVEKTLNISLHFVINEFLGIEELTGTMKVTATIIAQWQDDLMRWNPDEFNQLKAMPMLTKDVFLPTIVKDGNGGTQASIFMTGSGQNARDINGMVWVEHTGKVEAKVTGQYLSSCKLNLADFPFDEQTCYFVFKAWRFSDKRLTLQRASGQKLSEVHGQSIDVNINANANWMMTSVTSEDRTIPGAFENYSAIAYRVKASRRSDYYLWNVILPSISMAVLLLSTFFMPFGPERSMFSITLVLTMNIFQQALNSKLPVTAEVIPYVRQTTVQVILGIFITIQSAFVWWIAAKDKRMAVPIWLRYLVPKLRQKMKLMENQDMLLPKNLPRQLEPDYLLKSKQGKQLDEEASIAGKLSLHASRLSLASKFGGVQQASLAPEEEAIIQALETEEFLTWGDWLEVAQLCDLIALAITMGSIVILPIIFYRT